MRKCSIKVIDHLSYTRIAIYIHVVQKMLNVSLCISLLSVHYLSNLLQLLHKMFFPFTLVITPHKFTLKNKQFSPFWSTTASCAQCSFSKEIIAPLTKSSNWNWNGSWLAMYYVFYPLIALCINHCSLLLIGSKYPVKQLIIITPLEAILLKKYANQIYYQDFLSNQMFIIWRLYFPS